MSGLLRRWLGRGDGAGEPALTLARSMEELRSRTALHDGIWGQGAASWNADLTTGVITFRTDRGWTVTASVQVVGTLNAGEGTWLWGWDHPSVPEPLAADARAARDFGIRHGLERYATPMIRATEDEAWEFTAVACHLAGSQGAYRGPAGPTFAFMTFGEVRIAKGDDGATG